jgi:hypothetical protein
LALSKKQEREDWHHEEDLLICQISPPLTLPCEITPKIEQVPCGAHFPLDKSPKHLSIVSSLFASWTTLRNKNDGLVLCIFGAPHIPLEVFDEIPHFYETRY